MVEVNWWQTSGGKEPITATEKVKCLERELALRKKVYAKLVNTGAMKHADAEREIDIVTAILDDYKPLLEYIKREPDYVPASRRKA